MSIGTNNDPAATSSTGNFSTVAMLKGLYALLSGTNTIGATKDAGPSQTITRTHTSIADASGTTAITAAPTAGQKILLLDLIVSVATACTLTLEMETSGNDLAAFYMLANSTLQITPRGYIKGDLADKKLHVISSVASAVKVTAVYTSEA